MAPRFRLKKILRIICIFSKKRRERDHRKLGKELDLFSIADEAGPGLVIWHPKGAMLRYLIEEFERTEHLKRGYQMVVGPQILKTGTLGKIRTFRQLSRQHVFHQCGRDRLRHQANELPCSHGDIQIQDPVLSGSSAAIFRTWHCSSPRKERRAARIAESQTVHSG